MGVGLRHRTAKKGDSGLIKTVLQDRLSEAGMSGLYQRFWKDLGSHFSGQLAPLQRLERVVNLLRLLWRSQRACGAR